jgi:hypothetical protein
VTALLLRLCFAGTLCALAAGAAAQGIDCRDPGKPMLVIDLLFGRNIGGRLGVTEQSWSRFLAQEITPRFPDGLTVIDASGQWRDPARARIVRERSKLVMIVTPESGDWRARIDAVVAAYKSRFRQQSVGVVTRMACVTF